MYFAQTTKDRIKNLCKTKKINMEDMLIDCSLGINAIRQINDTKGMASFSLAKIADYLNCSVDYLLGRTDYPDIITKDNKGNIVLPELVKQNKNNSFPLTDTEKNLITDFRELNKQGQELILQQIYMAKAIYKNSNSISDMENAN